MTAWSVLKDKWNEYKKGIVIKTIIVLLCVLFGYFYNIVGVLGVLNGFIIGKIVIDSEKNKFKRLLVQCLSVNVFVLFLYFLNKTLGLVSAVLAFVIVTLVLTAYLLYKQWSLYMDSVRTIETMLFGAPLDKKIKRGKK